MPRQLLALTKVADQLDVSVSTVRRLIRRGDLRACRVGYQIRIEEDELTTYLRSLTPAESRSPMGTR